MMLFSPSCFIAAIFFLQDNCRLYRNEKCILCNLKLSCGKRPDAHGTNESTYFPFKENNASIFVMQAVYKVH